MYKLIALSGDDRGREWGLRPGRNTIGRAIGTSVRLQDSKASRTHCVVDVGGEIWLEDLQSLNATYLNGQPVQRVAVSTGAQITVGDTELLLTEAGGDWSDEQDKTAFQTEPHARKLRNFEAQLLGHGIVGRSMAIMEILEMIARVSRTDATVLITGPSGTGKELIAYAIHYCSPRKDHEFIPVSCAALSEILLESELFGHEEGAFAGAGVERDGMLSLARGGTLCLDEILDMPLGTQAKLLRALEDRSYVPLGSNRSQPVECRIVLATAHNLETAVSHRVFREDLYYRVNAIRIDIPPLRERLEDIDLLAPQFIETFCCQYAMPPKELTPAALAKLKSYSWPGNVRELQSCIERAVLLGVADQIGPADILIKAPPAR